MKGSAALFSVSAGILLLLTSCSSDRPGTASAAELSSPRVAVQPAVKPAQPSVYQATGPLVVENQVDVAAEREGVLAKILVDVGTRVHKGQLLAQFDDRQLTADRDAAKAKADATRADLKHWGAELKMRQSDLARAEAMWNADLITRQQLDHDRYSVEGGQYYLQRQNEDLNHAEAALKSAQLELDKTRIVAPFDGLVARRYVRVGQRVAGNDRLFWVTATAPLTARFTLPQDFVTTVKVGDEVTVSAPFDHAEGHQARVTHVSPVVDPSSGTIEVQAEVFSPAGELRPGMTVNIALKSP